MNIPAEIECKILALVCDSANTYLAIRSTCVRWRRLNPIPAGSCGRCIFAVNNTGIQALMLDLHELSMDSVHIRQIAFYIGMWSIRIDVGSPTPRYAYFYMCTESRGLTIGLNGAHGTIRMLARDADRTLFSRLRCAQTGADMAYATCTRIAAYECILCNCETIATLCAGYQYRQFDWSRARGWCDNSVKLVPWS